MKNVTGLGHRFTSLTLQIAGLLALILFLSGPPGMSYAATPTAHGTTIIVVNVFEDTKQDDGRCSLREAIIAANTDKKSGYKKGECTPRSGADTIRVPAGTYVLTRSDNGHEDAALTGDLDIKSDVTLMPDPQKPGPIIIDASGITDRVFHVISGNVIIKGVTITGGTVTADGGGIYNKGKLTITESTISNNHAKHDGGGIYLYTGTLTLNNSTISGNSSDSSGGGLYHKYGTTNFNNVTIAANTADKDSNDTGDGGGIRIAAGQLKLKNSLIAGNYDNSPTVQRPDCSGALKSLGYNLIGQATGCSLSGDLTGNIIGQDARLGPLADNGGPTKTHALDPASPAVDSGNNLTCLPTDQRGLPRQGAACDIGAFELQEVDPRQAGPIFTVNTTDDPSDGLCTVNHCSLREAIAAVNASAGGDNLEIHFDIDGQPKIQPTTTPLPLITSPVVISGTTQLVGPVEINGAAAGANAVGLRIGGADSTVSGLVISGFSSHGVQIETNGVLVEDSTIINNGGDGVRIVSDGISNTITGNSIFDNGGLGIDLGGDGITLNDPGDQTPGANNLQNTPVLFRASPLLGTNVLTIEGRLNSLTDTTYTLEFFANTSCDPTTFGEGEQFLGSFTVATTIEFNDVFFEQAFNPDPPVPEGQFITATATDPDGNTSEFSPCVTVGLDNDVWERAMPLPVLENKPNPVAVNPPQLIDVPGRDRWYKFKIEPGSQVTIKLTDLPADYDLFVYGDIQAKYNELIGETDLARLGAEFASASPLRGSPSRGSPSLGSPTRGSPSLSEYSATESTRGSPSRGSPSRGSPSPGAPSLYEWASADLLRGSPSRGSPSRGSPSRGSPSLSSAETLSFITASALDGPVDEVTVVNTWNNAGDFYVRVSGYNGATSLTQPFRLEISLAPGSCSGVQPKSMNFSAPNAGYKTIILHDVDRMGLDATDRQALLDALNDFANPTLHPEVNGVVVDVGGFGVIDDLNTQADSNPECPYGKNLVAKAIKDIIDAYRGAGNPLDYIVLIGNDDVIPFFRYPDKSYDGNEVTYDPPVQDNTTSQASLKLGYVLGQDEYGASTVIDVGGSLFPIPELAVGRLVETATDIITMLEAYEQTTGGVVPTPQSSFVSGYDFLRDGAKEVEAELAAGTGVAPDTLIDESPFLPDDPARGDDKPWSAAKLRTALFQNRVDEDEDGDPDGHDLIYLAGHFSANSALAADYITSLLTEDLVQTEVDFTNSIVFSPGCHSGYNIVNEHGIPFVTVEPDWAQAFAQKGATLIAGTGYQFGDTDFVEYSERLYLNFAQELRTGPEGDTVAVGQALVKAKQRYLAGTPFLRGLHEKVLFEAVLFGLPMLRVELPGRLDPPSKDSIVDATTPIGTDPGNELGLSYADITIEPLGSPASDRFTDLVDINNNFDVTAFHLTGSDGIVGNPDEPFLPLEVRNVSPSDPNLVLRGMRWRGGRYTDREVIPNGQPIRYLTSQPTTELGANHAPFLFDVFFPIQPWNVNYFPLLTDGPGAPTLLNDISGQVRSAEPGSEFSIVRQYDTMDFTLYYTGDLSDTVALANAPSIVDVSATEDATFSVLVVGDPAVLIQGVWVTYTVCPDTGPCNGVWQSIELEQTTDSRLWQLTRSPAELGAAEARHIRYIVQVVSGAGLVSMATNRGAYYVPGVAFEPVATSLSIDMPFPPFGFYGTQASFSAVLQDKAGNKLPGLPVSISLGSESRLGITDGNGRATVTLPLVELPGPQDIRASFGGTAAFAASAAPGISFTISKQRTQISLNPAPASGRPNEDDLIVATLTDVAGQPLAEETIFFVVTGTAPYSQSITSITNYLGKAPLGNLDLPFGDYNVKAHFSGEIALSTGETLTLVDGRYEPATAETTLKLINQPPQAKPDFYSTPEDIPLSTLTVITATSVLSNDIDLDNDPLTASLVITPAYGDLTFAAGGSFVYTPTLNFNGSDSFIYLASDGSDASTALVTIHIDPVNDPPIAVDDSYTVEQDKPLDVVPSGVLSNDLDIDGDDLMAILVSSPPKGDLALNPDGSFSYIPPVDFSQPVTFTYTAYDGVDDSNIATVTLNPSFCSTAVPSTQFFWPPNNKFKNVNIVLASQEPVTITVTSIFQDEPVKGQEPDGRGVGTSIAQIRVQRDGHGDGRVYLIGFTAVVAQGDTCSGTVRVAVAHDKSHPPDPGLIDRIDSGPPYYDSTASNLPPKANDDLYSTAEDTPLKTIAATGVLTNDTDLKGDALTASLASSPTHGSVILGSDGAFTYSPNPDFFGTDTFLYQASNGLEFATATVSINVTPVDDDPPLATDDSATTPENSPVIINVAANDIDVDGNLDVSSVIAVTLPVSGTVVTSGDGAITYTPNPNTFGLDSFDYQICDTGGLCDIASVTINVGSVNDPPVANDDSVTTDEDTSVTIAVAANDTDVDGNLDPASASIVSGPVNDNIVNNGDGTFSYTPNTDFNGSASFDYEICDSEGLCDTAAVTITVQPVNDQPAANDDSVSTLENTPVTIDVAANDTDVDGNLDPASARIVSDPANGRIVDNGDGTFSYTPNTDFNGSDGFDYEICDTGGLCDTATVTIQVSSVNAAPDAQDDAYVMSQGETLTISAPGVLANDVDPEADSLIITAVNGDQLSQTLPSGALLTLNADGSFTFTPGPDFLGEDRFTYTISDGNGGSDTATVNITVVQPDD